jgi:hypothetical protein
VGNDVGFYNEIACLMIRSMSPLQFRDGGWDGEREFFRPADNDVDDIVVSAFAIELVRAPFLSPNAADRPLPTAPNDVPQAVVVGRYPTNANECEVAQAGAGYNFNRSVFDNRDPFDYNNNGEWDHDELGAIPGFPSASQNPNQNYKELPGIDLPGSNVASAEKQVGFVWRGNHQIEGTGCYGSEWTIREVEALVNLPNFNMQVEVPGSNPNDAQREAGTRSVLPSQGIVLVELFWQHQMLLQLPVFNPVYDILGGTGSTTISVWAAFPLPSVEPFIIFPAP